MSADAKKYLWDVREAAGRIIRFVNGRSFDDYLNDEMLRAAVERQLEIIGEALSQLSKRDPDTANRIPDLARIVAFRNSLIHGYATVDDRLVWGFWKDSFPIYKSASTNCLLAVPNPARDEHISYHHHKRYDDSVFYRQCFV